MNSGAEETAAWSDTTARNTIWRALGNSGNARNNNHLVIGDMVTIGKTTKQWMGSFWDDPGIVINGNMLVNGTIAGQKLAANTVTADKIDSRGLTIKDASGNIIFGSGNNLDFSRINGLGELARQSTVATSQLTGNLASSRITGLGALATQDYATVSSDWRNSTVMFQYGDEWRLMGTGAFVTELNKIRSNNIANFMESAAIGSAYIGNAAVGTLHIKDNAVTVPVVYPKVRSIRGEGWPRNSGTPTSWVPYSYFQYTADEDMRVCIVAVALIGTDGSTKVEYAGTRLLINGIVYMSQNGDWNHIHSTNVYIYSIDLKKGENVAVQLDFGGESCMLIYSCHFLFIGTKR